MMVTNFDDERKENIRKLGIDDELKSLSNDWIKKSSLLKYSYNFDWLGRPIIQLPQDIIAMQEIIWNTKPDLIIETGVARGGSLIFYSSMLELIGSSSRIIGIDVDIRERNRKEIEQHPMFKRITLLEGSSIDKDIIKKVFDIAKNAKRVLVCLDSDHTHDHVLEEMRVYSPLVKKGSYLIVFDTVIEDLPDNFFPDRPWGKGNNPKTAVNEFLKRNDRFKIDESVQNKLLISVAPNGYLKCIKD